MERPSDKVIAKLIQEFKSGELSQYQMEEKMRKLGIEYPSVILMQWELI